MTVQYPDVNVSVANYNHLKETELLVTKIFGITLQGEGPLAGTPAVFVRLAGCDKGDKVSCPWCDTNFINSEGTVTPSSEIIKTINSKFNIHYGTKPPLIILSGGEPMMQDNIVRLIEALHAACYRIQIESNGDRLADGFLESEACKQAMLVVSPKVLPSSKKYRRLIKDVFERADYLKFVVEADKTSPYHTLPPYMLEWMMKKGRVSNSVFISPSTVYSRPVKPGEIASIWNDDAIDKEKTFRNYAYAAQLCCVYGYRLSCQTHTFTGVE